MVEILLYNQQYFNEMYENTIIVYIKIVVQPRADRVCL